STVTRLGRERRGEGPACATERSGAAGRRGPGAREGDQHPVRWKGPPVPQHASVPGGNRSGLKQTAASTPGASGSGGCARRLLGSARRGAAGRSQEAAGGGAQSRSGG